MAYIGKNPKFNSGTYTPQSTEPSNPTEGMTYYDDGTNRAEGLYVYKNGQWTEVGSGSAGINYIENGDAEAGTTGWATYADAAGEAPVDGTGGSATVTLTATTSSPLRGVSSLLITKDAANRQGEGASYDFTVDSADQAKVLRISMDFESSANYADGDIRVYVYDVTNAALIEVVDRDLPANANGKYIGEFQTASDSTSYRLIVHTSSTNASAYTIKFDNLQVGPREIAKGSIVTDWEAYTPTFSGLTLGNGTLISNYRRVGDSIELNVNVDFGSTTSISGGVTFSLPSGLSIDTTKVDRDGANRFAGEAVYHDDSANTYFIGTLNLQSDNTFALFYLIDNGTAENVSGLNTSVPFTWTTNDKINLRISVPIQGWSANSDISTDFGSRVVCATGAGNGGTSITANTTNIDFTEVTDTTGSFDGTTFTVPETGRYLISGGVLATTSAIGSIFAYVNGSSNKVVGFEGATAQFVQFNSILELSKGDLLTFRSDGSFTLSNDTARHVIAIEKLASPQTLIGSETVAAYVTSDNGQSVANSSTTTIVYEDVIDDTHGAYNSSTGVYTIPVSGFYQIDGLFTYLNALNVTQRIHITVNGVDIMTNEMLVVNTTKHPLQISASYRLEKGDTVQIRGFQDSGFSQAIRTAQALNYFSIIKR